MLFRSDQIDVPGLEVEFGGQVFQQMEMPASEVLGLLAAVVVLLVAFGSVIAMGLPIGTAIMGLGAGMAIVGLLSKGMSVPEFGPQMTAMIGLGVGIDYALFIVSRFREHLHLGEDPETATVAAVDSSGRAVIFAAITVMISLLGLFLMRVSFVGGLAVSGAVGVFVMMLASITLLPALLGFTGTRIHTTSRVAAAGVTLFVACGLVGVAIGQLGALIAAGLVVALLLNAVSLLPFARILRRPIPQRVEKPVEQQFWYRWSRFVQRRPWPMFALGAGVLVALSLPLFAIRLGFSDTGNQPKDSTVRKAYDLVADGFGPGAKIGRAHV